MKILTPVKNLISGVEIIKSGADEIYFGVVSSDWENKHGYKSILNRRDGTLANISSFEDGKKLINFAKNKGVKAYVTLNNSPIIDDLELIREEIKNVILMKPDALIVKDIIVAQLIRDIDRNVEIHCSSLNQVINTDAVQYWIDNFSITRMIFPRNITIAEIRKICLSFPKMEFEVFVKNDWCYNSDGICSSLHFEGLKEGIPFVCHREKMYKTDNDEYMEKYLELYNKMYDCKICMIGKLYDIKNLVSLKIVGREKPLSIILNDLNFIKNSIKFLKLSSSFEEYRNFNAKLFDKTMNKKCPRNNCEMWNIN